LISKNAGDKLQEKNSKSALGKLKLMTAADCEI